MTDINSDIDDYIGFYTNNHFWVGERLDWDDELHLKLLRAPIVPEIRFTYDGPDFKAAVTIDGLILLHIKRLAAKVPKIGHPESFTKAVQWWDEYLDCIHSLQILIESATIAEGLHNKVTACEITSVQTCTVGMFGWEPQRRAESRGQNNLSVRFDTLRWILLRDGPPTPEVLDTRSFNYAVLQVGLLSKIFAQFSHVAQNRNTLTWLSFLTRAKSAYERGDFRIAFLHAWFVIESVCRKMFDEHGPTHSRGKNLKSVETYLLEHGFLSPTIGEAMSKLRKKRNELTHEPGSAVCMPSDAYATNEIALQLIGQYFPFPLITTLTHSLSY